MERSAGGLSLLLLLLLLIRPSPHALKRGQNTVSVETLKADT